MIALLGRGEIEYIPFPESLRGKYQSFTESDISRLAGRRLRPAVRRPSRKGFASFAERAGKEG